MSRPARILAAIVVAAVLVVSCSRLSGTSGTEARFAGRVDTTDTGLLLDATPWWPVGFNAYQLGTDWSVNVGCGAQVDLDTYFRSLPPRSLTRFNLYSSLAVDKSTGMLNFSPLDAVFAAAARHDQMVLPVLTGSSGACEDEAFRERGWYERGWQATIGPAGLTYADWLTAAVQRWRDESALAGWELVGEPEASLCGSDDCRWQARRCPPGGADVLRAFFDDAGGRLRDLDDAHPIFAGFVGGDQCGLAGTDLVRVAQSENLDVLDFHDYPDDAGSQPAGSNLSSRIDQARSLGKPLVVNEIGVQAGSCRTLDERAALVRERIDWVRAAGAAGALVWAFVPDPRVDDCTYDVGYDDPLYAVIADLADR